MRIRFMVAAALWLLGTSHTAAQQAEIRFLAERVPDEIPEVLMASEDRVGDPFELPTRFLSEPQRSPARSFEIQTADERQSLARVTLPERGKAFIILLLPDPEGGYLHAVIPANEPSFRPGDNYFYNHTPRPIVGYVGDSKFTLEPGEGRVVRPAGADERGFHAVGFGVREEEGTRALSSTRWPVDNELRSYIFFFVNPETRRIDYRAVDEFVPPEEDE